MDRKVSGEMRSGGLREGRVEGEVEEKEEEERGGGGMEEEVGGREKARLPEVSRVSEGKSLNDGEGGENSGNREWSRTDTLTGLDARRM